MLAGLRTHDAHVARGAIIPVATARIALSSGACGSALGAEGLRTAAIERMFDERVATEPRRAARVLREGIAGIDLNWRPHVWAPWIDVYVEASVGWSSTSGSRPRGARTPALPGVAATRGAAARVRGPAASWRDLDGSAAMEQRESGAECRDSPDSPAHE